MPGGSEWILILLFLCLGIAVPVAAIYYYAKSKRLLSELQKVTEEKNILLAKLLEKSC